MSATDYETGIASSPADLLTKLETFAAANGWTVSSPTSGRVFRKDTVVVGMSTDADDVFAKGAITYNAAAAWDNQTNDATETLTCNTGVGPFTAYHFFTGAESGSDYLHAAIEVAAGRYRHIAFGELVKYGSYTGGVYVGVVNWSQSSTRINVPESTFHSVLGDSVGTNVANHVWADYDSLSNQWLSMVNASATPVAGKGTGSIRGGGLGQMFPAQGYQAWNLRTNLAPINFFGDRSSSLRSPLGRIPDMRSVGLQNLSPGETLSIGGDTWMVFPIAQRTESYNNTPSSIESSAYAGYAYLMP
jgi:hypothetical protein